MSHLHALQLSSCYRESLVLLPGYAEMGSEIKTLQLPSLVIPGLFFSDRIAVAPTSVRNRSNPNPNSAHSDENSNIYGPPPGLSSPSSTEHGRLGSLTPPPPPYPDQSEAKGTPTDVTEAKTDDLAEGLESPSHSSETDRRHRVILGRAAGPVSYRPSTQRWTQDRPRSAGDSSADSTEGTKSGAYMGKSFGKQRKINRDIVRKHFRPYAFPDRNGLSHAKLILAPCSAQPSTLHVVLSRREWVQTWRRLQIWS